jgi:hypothetical protein
MELLIVIFPAVATRQPGTFALQHAKHRIYRFTRSVKEQED